MPLSQADRQLLAGGASLSTIKTLRKFYRGDFHAQTELDKTQGVNDEVPIPVRSPAYMRGSSKPGMFTGAAPGCPLAWSCWLFGLFVLVEFGMKVFTG